MTRMFAFSSTGMFNISLQVSDSDKAGVCTIRLLDYAVNFP
jgi:hypothetical protein